MTIDASNTPVGFARIGLVDKLEAIIAKYPNNGREVIARGLKRELIASAFGTLATLKAEKFLAFMEAEGEGNRPPALPDLKQEI
jgi:hypothetical protein